MPTRQEETPHTYWKTRRISLNKDASSSCASSCWIFSMAVSRAMSTFWRIESQRSRIFTLDDAMSILAKPAVESQIGTRSDLSFGIELKSPRHKLRKIFGDEKLNKETQDALQTERERKKRIEEKRRRMESDLQLVNSSQQRTLKRRFKKAGRLQ